MATRRNDETSAGRRKKRASKSGALPLFVAGCGVVFLLLTGASVVGVLWALGVFAKAPDSGAGNQDKDRSGKPAAAKPRDRLVGQWEHSLQDTPGAKMTLEFVADGKVTLVATNKASVTRNGRWEVLGEKTDRLTIRLRFNNHPDPADWDIEFLNNDSMRVNSLTSMAPPFTYQRKP